MTQNLIEFEEAIAFRNHPLISSAQARGENRNVFEAFIRDFVRDLQPRGPVEATLAARAAGLAWRLNRAQKLETVALSNPAIGGERPIETGLRNRYGRENIEMISRWEQSIERSLLKVLDALERRQKLRGDTNERPNNAENHPEIESAIQNETNSGAKVAIVLAG